MKVISSLQDVKKQKRILNGYSSRQCTRHTVGRSRRAVLSSATSSPTLLKICRLSILLISPLFTIYINILSTSYIDVMNECVRVVHSNLTLAPRPSLNFTYCASPLINPLLILHFGYIEPPLWSSGQRS
jgi:hypothetical protein